MDASPPTPEVPLPEDVATLQAMVRQLLAEVARLRAENAALQNKLDQVLRQRSGRRSERRRRPRRRGDDQPAPQHDPHGRGVLPEHLPRREVVHDLTEAEKCCPCCGRLRVCIGVQTAEQAELEPAQLYVLRTIKKTYACQHCDQDTVPVEQRIQTAGPAQVGPLAKGLCGPGLLAHIITAKFADHNPLHRQTGQLARGGLRLAASTLGEWMAQAAVLCGPLVEQMRQEVLRSRVIHSDDTSVRLRVMGSDRTRKAYLWTYLGDADHPCVVFDFTADHTAATGPEAFLKDYRGYLQADALAQYERLYAENGIKHCCCWAHCRRKFVAAVEGGDERGNAALDWIGQLYAIERHLPPLLSPATDPLLEHQRRQREEERRRQRQLQARPILEQFKQWLLEQEGKVLPKSALGQAVGYTRNNWEALERYLEQGYLSIDNNLSERTLRAIALGRNNWGVIGSITGGKTAAVLYSLVGTCKYLGIDPLVYLREALAGLFGLGEKPTAEQLNEWLPHRWFFHRARASPVGTARAS
jgi:transposase